MRVVLALTWFLTFTAFAAAAPGLTHGPNASQKGAEETVVLTIRGMT